MAMIHLKIGDSIINLNGDELNSILAITATDSIMSKGSSGRSKPSEGVKLYSVDIGSVISNNQYTHSVLVTIN